MRHASAWLDQLAWWKRGPLVASAVTAKSICRKKWKVVTRMEDKSRGSEEGMNDASTCVPGSSHTRKQTPLGCELRVPLSFSFFPLSFPPHPLFEHWFESVSVTGNRKHVTNAYLPPWLSVCPPGGHLPDLPLLTPLSSDLASSLSCPP